MATNKLFKVCGFSKLNGQTKLRFANDSLRVKVLAKHGHEDINLVEFDSPVTKLEAAKLLSQIDEFQTSEYQALIADYIERNSSTVDAVEVEVTVETALV